jgi:hypothetical protein
VLIYKNWPHDARLDDKMVEGFASYFFATKDAFLNDNEQLLVDGGHYEDAWRVSITWSFNFFDLFEQV